MSFKQRLTQMLGSIAFRSTYAIKFLVNDTPKKIGLFVVLLFAFLAQSELEVLFWQIPDFNQLTVNEGKIKITSVTARIGSIDTLYILISKNFTLTLFSWIAGGR